MKKFLALVIFVFANWSAAHAASRNYQCIADRLQAYDSDIYYNLSPSEIDELLANAGDARSSKVAEVAQECEKVPMKCFKAESNVYGLPAEICLSNISFYKNTKNEDTLVLAGNLNISSNNVIWADYDSQIVLAKFKFVEFNETCGSSLVSSLNARIKIASGGQIENWDSLSLSVSYSSTNDSCHSEWQDGVVHYSLVR